MGLTPGLDAQAMRLLLGGAAARSCLTLLGIGEYLQWRVEVSTPANSLLSIREGLLLQGMQLSPYSGSQCRTPPLTLLLYQSTTGSGPRYVLPNLLLDLLSGLMLRQVASSALHQAPGPPQGFLTPNTIMGMYLLNPLSLASCVSGSSSSLDSWAVLATCWMATRKSWLGTAAALAVAIYSSPHAALLLVPTALLLLCGPEQVRLPQVSSSPPREHHSNTAAATTAQPPASGNASTKPASQQTTAIPKQAAQSSTSTQQMTVSFTQALLHFLALATLVAMFLLVLFIASDMIVSHLPGAACLLAEGSGISPIRQLQGAMAWFHSGTSPRVQGSGRCWAASVYGLQLNVEDLTPNMGQVWYFFTEMFKPYLSFFRFVIHSLAAVLVLPLAIRFPGKPVFLFVIQCLMNCMFKPYPSVADHALYLGLIPLLKPHMAVLRTGMLLSVTWGLLAVLEVSMWHQWINIESANSNFYYSISLILGAWQTFLLVQLLTLCVKTERLCKLERTSKDKEPAK